MEDKINKFRAIVFIGGDYVAFHEFTASVIYNLDTNTFLNEDFETWINNYINNNLSKIEYDEDFLAERDVIEINGRYYINF